MTVAGDVNAVDIGVAVVHQRVVEIAVRALPLQRYGIAVAGVAEDHGAVRIELCLVGDPERTVGEAGIDHGSAGVDRGAGVELRESRRRQADGHDVFAVGSRIVGDREFAAVVCP